MRATASPADRGSYLTVGAGPVAGAIVSFGRETISSPNATSTSDLSGQTVSVGSSVGSGVFAGSEVNISLNGGPAVVSSTVGLGGGTPITGSSFYNNTIAWGGKSSKSSSFGK